MRKKKDSSVRLYSFIWVIFAALAIALSGNNSSVEAPDQHLAAAPQEGIQIAHEKPTGALSGSRDEQQVALAGDTEQVEPEPEPTTKEKEEVPAIAASEEPEEELLVVSTEVLELEEQVPVTEPREELVLTSPLSESETEEELVVITTQVPATEEEQLPVTTISDLEVQPEAEAIAAVTEEQVLEVAEQEQVPAVEPSEELALTSPLSESETEEELVASTEVSEAGEETKQEGPPVIDEPDDLVLAVPTVVVTEKKFSVHEGPVWQAMALALQNWEGHPPITLASRRDGIISSTYEYANPEVEDIDKFAIRPTIEGGVWEKGRWRFQITVNEYDDGTRVDIDLVAEAYESAKTAAWHKCRSRGILEKMIFDDIEHRLDNWIKKEVLLPPELIF